MVDVKISELDTATAIDNDTLFEVSVKTGPTTYETKNTTLLDIQTAIGGGSSAISVYNVNFLAAIFSQPVGPTWAQSTGGGSIRGCVWIKEYNRIVAVGTSGTGNRVVTSNDYGISWTARASAADVAWRAVCYSPQLNRVVAVAQGSVSNCVQYSNDGGITWTIVTGVTASSWQNVCWCSDLNGSGMFVAIADGGTSRVMTSPDGITWTARTAAAATSWNGVAYSPELKRVVATSQSSNVMYSNNGIDWTLATASTGGNAIGNLSGVAWCSKLGNSVGKFVAFGNAVATSQDGMVWTLVSGSYSGGYTVISAESIGAVFLLMGTSNTGSLVSTDGVTFKVMTNPAYESSIGSNHARVICGRSGVWIPEVSKLLTPDYGGVTLSGVDNGVYLPSITNLANVASVTPNLCYWSRQGRTITVTGSFSTGTPGGNSVQSFNMSLPVPTGFGPAPGETRLNGMASTSGSALSTMTIYGNTTPNNAGTAIFNCVTGSTDLVSKNWRFSFTYFIP